MSKERRDAGYRHALFGVSLAVRLLAYVLAAVFLIYLGRTSYSYGYAVFNEQPVEAAPGRDIVVIIPEDPSVKTVGQILRTSGLIDDEVVFRIQERISPYHGRIAPGTYTLNTSQTVSEMLEIMAADEAEDTGNGS